MQSRISHEKAVRLSIRLTSDKPKVLPGFYTVGKTFILVFQDEEWLVGDDPLYMKFWVKLAPFLQKRQFLIDICS